MVIVFFLIDYHLLFNYYFSVLFPEILIDDDKKLFPKFETDWSTSRGATRPLKMEKTNDVFEFQCGTPYRHLYQHL